MDLLENIGTMQLMSQLVLPAIFPTGLKMIEDAEGWVPYLYNDAVNYCTIGFGHLMKKAPCDGTEPYQDGLTLPTGVSLLQGDLKSAQATVGGKGHHQPDRRTDRRLDRLRFQRGQHELHSLDTSHSGECRTVR